MITDPNPDLARLFLSTARKELMEKYWPQLRECVRAVGEEQIWWRPNDASNSIGNLLLHLNGNVGQWIVASFHRRKDERNRPQEFAEHGPVPVAGLMARLAATLEQADAEMARLTAEELAATYEIQGCKVTGLDAIYHAISHFALHYGQIAFITKMLQNRDLGFYLELNKSGRYS